MEEAKHKIQYNKSLELAVQEFFCTYIVPANFLAIIHKHAPQVLADDDIARLRKKIQNSNLIDKEISQELLDTMVRYTDWFQCILDVLEDPSMKQKDLVKHFKTMKDEHDDKYFCGNKRTAERFLPVVASQSASTVPKQLASDNVNNSPATKEKRKPKVKQSQSVDGSSSSSLPQQAETKSSLQADGACGQTADAKAKKKPRGKQNQSADCSTSSSLPPQDEINGSLQADGAFGQTSDAKSKRKPKVKQSQSVDCSSSSSFPPQDEIKGSLQADGACEQTADAKFIKKQAKPKPLAVPPVKPSNPSAQQIPPQVANEPPKVNKGTPSKSVPTKKNEPIQGQPGQANCDPNSFCSLCQAKFTSAVDAEKHYSGQKHKKNLEEMNSKMATAPQKDVSGAVNPPSLPDLTNKPVFYLDENGQGHCNLCDVKFASSNIADAHLQGNKHKVNMALYKAKK